MISWNEMEQLGRDAAKLARRGASVSIVLSVVCSLPLSSSLSKRHVSDYLWIDFAAFAVPILIALYFKKHVGLLRYLYLCCRPGLGRGYPVRYLIRCNVVLITAAPSLLLPARPATDVKRDRPSRLLPDSECTAWPMARPRVVFH